MTPDADSRARERESITDLKDEKFGGTVYAGGADTITGCVHQPFQPVDIGQDFGHGVVEIHGHVLTDLNILEQGARQGLLLDDGNVMPVGDLVDALGDMSGAFGDDQGCRQATLVLHGDGQMGGVGDDDGGLGTASIIRLVAISRWAERMRERIRDRPPSACTRP